MGRNPRMGSAMELRFSNQMLDCRFWMVLGALFLLPLLVQADRSGEEVYNLYCMQCHGPNMEGGQAASFIDGVWNYGSGIGQHRRNIAFGIIGTQMVAWDKVLTDPEIDAVLEYILEAEANLKVQPPPPPTHFETEDYRLNIEILAEGLQQPWGITFLDKRTAIFTEFDGKLRLLVDNKVVDQPISGTPAALRRPSGNKMGFMDIAADPNYTENGWIYLTYAHEAEHPVQGEPFNRSALRVVRGRIRNGSWVDEEIIYSTAPKHYLLNTGHIGSRLLFDREGYLYFSTGDRDEMMVAQDLNVPYGKIHRIYPDGSVPESNPFFAMGKVGALPTIYAYGSRNAQGLAMHPVTGDIWSTEHGQMGGDELNKIEPGVNLGWPVITLGLDRDNTPLTPYKEWPGMVQPKHYWTPSPAIGAIEFCTSPLFPKWENNLLVAALKHKNIRRLVLEGDKVVKEEFILRDCGRIRDISTGPDGSIYVLVDLRGFILRLTPDTLP
ncbi:MAG: PQQ-dependent sugar dehydrogenase [Verrucomicrobia bacterium]|nr:PQQ-dependent sugar dehydrogenase [Verrucomicrobiota bacterium]